MTTKPSELSVDYYSFKKYVTRHRLLTYWYQIKELLSLHPSRILEIGVGSGMVTAYLASLGISIETIDINSKLKPTYVGSVLDLNKVVERRQYDVILCARVLHHLPFERFGQALSQVYTAITDNGYLILTLPKEDFSFYLMFRYTSSSICTLRISLPSLIKRALLWSKTRSGLWKIDDSKEHSICTVRNIIKRHFDIVNEYHIPEDAAHYLFVLHKKLKDRDL
jgi:2-polyprenyl-3-methyl-5-hydroxy-6-metoxy-1,4-benzoquinol methylase